MTNQDPVQYSPDIPVHSGLTEVGFPSQRPQKMSNEISHYTTNRFVDSNLQVACFNCLNILADNWPIYYAWSRCSMKSQQGGQQPLQLRMCSHLIFLEAGEARIQ